jgi:MAF protein
VLESTVLTNQNFILASTSPRRRQLFGLFGIPFDVVPADIDETPCPDESPLDYVRRLAREKAVRVASLHPFSGWILASDTIVVDGDQILGKPADSQQAASMLRQLAGRTHQVYTAVHLRRTDDLLNRDDLCVTDVPMRNYNEEEIAAYVASGDPMDKAGAYAIQNASFHPVDHLEGCYASVMGLPLCHVARNLEKAGWKNLEPVFEHCQVNLDYVCPVYRSILNG